MEQLELNLVSRNMKKNSEIRIRYVSFWQSIGSIAWAPIGAMKSVQHMRVWVYNMLPV